MEKINTITVNGATYQIGGSGGAVIETTYDELKALVESTGLTKGNKYRIIDYVTDFISDQTNIKSGLHQFDIIVTASSNNSLYEDAEAAIHNGDNYFIESNLEAWKLKYSITSSKFKKGEITYLMDDKLNEANFDFKNIMFLIEAQYFTHLDTDTYFYLFSSVDSYTGEKNIKDHSLTDSVKRNICDNTYSHLNVFCVKKSAINTYGSIVDNYVKNGAQVRLFENNSYLHGSISNNKINDVFFTLNPLSKIDNNDIRERVILSTSASVSINLVNNIIVSEFGRNQSNPVAMSKNIESCIVIGDFTNVTEIAEESAVSNKIITAKNGAYKIIDLFDII